MTVIVANPERGCGTKKEGGCYGESGDRSPNGTLLENWCLGSHIEEQENFYVEVPPRGVWLFNPAASLISGNLVSDLDPHMAGAYDASDAGVIRKVGGVGLIDHVGAAHYTPRSFAAEAFEHGISRRLPPSTAREIARLCPLPIFFVARLPIFPDDISAISAWASMPHEDEEAPTFNMTPSWRDSRWSLRRQRDDYAPYRGRDHYIAQLMEAGALEGDALRSLPVQQMVFFAGWITRVTYILRPDETDLPSELAGSGVLPGILEDDARVAHELQEE